MTQSSDSQERYRGLLDGLGQGYAYGRLLRDSQGEPVDIVLLEVNDLFCLMFNSHQERILGSPFSTVFPEFAGRLGPWLDVCNQAIRDQSRLRIERYFLPMRKWLSALIWGQGEDHVGILVEDVTERWNLQERAQQNMKLSAVGQFATGIAHEFNNILAIIKGSMEMIHRVRQDPPLLQEFVDRIARQVDRGRDLVARMSRFSRPMELHIASHPLVDLLEETVLLHEPLAEQKGIKLTWECGWPGKVPVDRDQLQQVLINLIRNGFHAIASKSGGHIHLAGDVCDGELRIRVRDDGAGMDEETKRRLFTPFFTTKGARAGRCDVDGTGLGLSLSHAIISAHGGRIAVESNPGEGAEFEIRLPMTRENRDNEIEPEAISVSRKADAGLRILVVDDEQDVAEILCELLLDLGVSSVRTAPDGKSAVRLVQEEEWDGVLLDLILPDMRGEAVHDSIRQLSPYLPVVYCSGRVDVNPEQLAAQGAAGFIRKPFAIDDISNALKLFAT